MKQSVRSIKTEGYYVYYHQTPDKLVYFGVSQQQPYTRWNPSLYKKTALESYIKEFGWKNIKHAVIQDGLTKEQAYAIENALIKQGKIDGFCINNYNSGGKTHSKEERQKYYKMWRELNSEHKSEYDKEYSKQYRKTHIEEIKEYRKQYNSTHREQRREYERQYREKNREKINQRVREYRQKKKAALN